MNKNSIFRWINGLYLKMVLTISTTRRIHIGKRFKIGKNSIVKNTQGKGTLNISDCVSIKNNVEITADRGGTIRIGKDVFINNNVMIVSRGNITIGDGVTIGPNTIIYDHNHEYDSKKTCIGKITIGAGTWIGGNVTILKDVTIGENSIIAAGSVVTKNIPDDVILIQKRNNSIYLKNQI